MTSDETRLELDKILAAASAFAVTEGGKRAVSARRPAAELAEAREKLAYTREASILLFEAGAGGVEYFPPLGDSLERAEKGATLSCAELLAVSRLLRAARVFCASVERGDARIVKFREEAARIYTDVRLEEDICDKIVGENELADHASETLFAVRREIRLIGERIRARLNAFLTGEERKYLQDDVVTVRGDRYVVPVRAEYKRSVKGFVHDRSASGATVFIEPEEVLEMNNELRSLRLDEQQEIERILSELSASVGRARRALERDEETLSEADASYACAEYCYRLGCTEPTLNDRGVVDIVKGRHPLLDRRTATPVSVSVGEKFHFLLISGANTGGKTVTLKMCGLFCLMAACGFFVPAAAGTRLAVFGGVYCDIGDSQSIEENLSTFSSHVARLREILARADGRSFVLIDEPGGGTDPEEGQAIARAVLDELLSRGCRGIFTTHYSALKEYAFAADGVENGCMEFDERDFRPLFRLKLGAPGASNALAICTRLGLDQALVERARGYLTEGARSFERTVRAAEESGIRAEEARREAEAREREWRARLEELEKEETAFRAEREKFLRSSKAQARRIVNERTARAEELLAEMEEVFRKETLTESDLVRARTLKNKIKSLPEEEEKEKVRAIPVDASAVKAGDRVFVGALGTEGVVLAVNREKATAEVRAGQLRVRSKFSDLYVARGKKEEGSVRVALRVSSPADAARECDLIGLNVEEALERLDGFLDAATLASLEQVRIVHGMGTGKLREAVKNFLRKDSRVKEFRLGVYGEGESGVTIATLR